MDLTLSGPYQALQAEVRDFIRQHGDKSPKVGGGRKRPDQEKLDWQKRLAEFGCQNLCAEETFVQRY
jgi:hypothetical protein